MRLSPPKRGGVTCPASAPGDLTPVTQEGFAERVRAVVAAIPAGLVLTYGDVATLAGSPRAARPVGQLLRQTLGEELPWHRVVNASGAISSGGDVHRPRWQRERLASEGVRFDAQGRIDLARYRWTPSKGSAVVAFLHEGDP